MPFRKPSGIRMIVSFEKIWKILPRFVRVHIRVRVQRVLNRFKLNKLDQIYDEDYFRWHLGPDILSEQEYIAEVLYSKFKPKSVVDFGCGVGSYLHYFQKLGVEKVQGFEGSSSAFPHLMIDSSLVEKRDLRDFIEVPTLFDLCLCFEVLEHIHAKFEEKILSSLCNSSDLLCLSAAQPHQGGTHHINERPQEYWMQRLREKGFILNRKVTNELRITLRTKIHQIPWMIPNIMIFEREK